MPVAIKLDSYIYNSCGCASIVETPVTDTYCLCLNGCGVLFNGLKLSL